MKTIKLTFRNKEGQDLAARLEMPVDKNIHAYAIFAHCFTCTKNLMAVTNISRALTSKGLAVLRFDFAGLGESDGEFADTNFSSNVDDLISAANYLKENYEAPKLLLGHSLGGAAVLMAANALPEVETVATVGAPAEPFHVKKLFKSSMEEIKALGKAEVNIGGRPFTIKKQFIDDLEKYAKEEFIKDLDRPLLILHSPQDEIVGIKNAEMIYQTAMHPKSYISLDGADHLLSKREDALYVGEVVASWASRYIEMNRADNKNLNTDRQVVVRNEKEKGYQTEIMANGHYMLSDEPEDLGGSNTGGTPYDYLVSALGACTAITLRMYSDRKGWDLQEVKVHLNREKRHPDDAKGLKASDKVDFIDRELEFTGELSDDQKKRLVQIADKCPVHKTLSQGVNVETHLKD